MNVAAIREAIKALETAKQEKESALSGKLRECARRGKRTKFQFNHLGIRYLISDKYGNISLRWLVSNGITGRQETYYTKDYMSKNGKVLWRILAGKINKT